MDMEAVKPRCGPPIVLSFILSHVLSVTLLELHSLILFARDKLTLWVVPFPSPTMTFLGKFSFL